MRPEKLYLTDLVEAADAIQRFIIGITPDDFLNDELRQSAVLQKLIVIGEAAARLSPDFSSAFLAHRMEQDCGSAQHCRSCLLLH